MEENNKIEQDRNQQSEVIESTDTKETAKVQTVSNTSRLIGIVLGLLGALYFGAVVIMQSAVTIMDFANSSTAFHQENYVWSLPEISSLLVSILLFVCSLIMMWASIKVVQSSEEGRLTWVHTALVAGIFSVLAIGVAGWKIEPTDFISGIDTLFASLANGYVDNYIKDIVLFNIVPLLIFIFGGFILTRASVKKSFL